MQNLTLRDIVRFVCGGTPGAPTTRFDLTAIPCRGRTYNSASPLALLFAIGQTRTDRRKENRGGGTIAAASGVSMRKKSTPIPAGSVASGRRERAPGRTGLAE